MTGDKSEGADLEGKRLTMFLMGLILVLASLFVALEYNAAKGDPYADDEDIIGQMMAEGVTMPMMSHVETPPPPDLPARSESEGKIKVVADEELSDDTDDTDDEELTADSLLAAADTVFATAGEPLPAAPLNTADEENPLHFRVVEDMPQFPGGQAAFVKFLTVHLRYPSSAQQLRMQGKVAATFIVERDGQISDIRIVQSLYPECDNEALRVLRKMPKWTPGRQNGEPCRTMVCVPIVFKM